MRYISEGTELYKNDEDKTWVASFQDPEDCKAVADSLNSKNELDLEIEVDNVEELEPALC